MKINVHAGHNFIVQGAGGQFSETKEDRNVKDKVIKHLKDAGHTVYDCTDDKGPTANSNLYNIVAKCNAHAVDLDVSIHFNAYNGTAHGTEVWVHTGSTIRKTAQRIADNIAALGFTNRGVKDTTSLYVIRKTNSPALLIECCFCDSKTDAKLYDADKMAKAIAEGILNKKINEPQATSSAQKSNAFLVRLVEDATVRKTASKDSEAIDQEKKNDYFTVIEVSSGGNWYRRKLGGWVPAKKCKKV